MGGRRRRGLVGIGGIAALLLAGAAPATGPIVGSLTELPTAVACVSDNGSGGSCQDGVALAGASTAAQSPDGKQVYVASQAPSGGVSVFSRDPATGRLAQLPGTAGCVSDNGSGGACADGVGLVSPFGIAASPDGRNVYVTDGVGHGVSAFKRDKKTGALTQLPGTAACVSDNGSGGTCADGVALLQPLGVAVSPDSKQVYVAAQGSDAIAVFARDKKTGALSQLGGLAACVSETGSGGACADGVALDGPAGLTVSADGKHLYAASSLSDAVASFARDKKTGALTQLPGVAACISETGSGGACRDGVALDVASWVSVSKDGTSAYVGSTGSNAVAALQRDPATGGLTQSGGTAACVSDTGSGGACVDGVGLDDVFGVSVSPDDRHVYAGTISGDTVSVFTRNPVTSEITQLPGKQGCVSETGTGGACTDGAALDGPVGVLPTRDGKELLFVSFISNAVGGMVRDPATGALSQVPSPGCVGSGGPPQWACTSGVATNGGRGVALSPDGKTIYLAASAGGLEVFARNTKTGFFSQLPGTAGCVSENGTGGACVDGRGLNATSGVAVSPDGKHVYAASFGDGVSAFTRNKKNGSVTQLAGLAGCASDDGNAGECTDGTALIGGTTVAVSPDGKNVYVAAEFSFAVVVFARNTKTGELTQLAGTAGCISEDGSAGACVDGVGLSGAFGVAVSPDGKHVYVASQGSSAVASFARDPVTGALTQLAGTGGCTSETGSGGGCIDGVGLSGATIVAVAPDGSHVYVAAQNADGGVSAFARNPLTGALTQLASTNACISETGSSGACVDGVGLGSALGVAVSPAGDTVYAGAFGANAVAVLARDNPVSGVLVQLGGTNACVSETGSGGSCADGVGLTGARGVTVSLDGKNVYVATGGGLTGFARVAP